MNHRQSEDVSRTSLERGHSLDVRCSGIHRNEGKGFHRSIGPSFGDHSATLTNLLPLPEGEGRSEGEQSLILNKYVLRFLLAILFLAFNAQAADSTNPPP